MAAADEGGLGSASAITRRGAAFAAATGVRPLQDPIAELTLLGRTATQVMATAVGHAIYEAEALPWSGAQPACGTALAPSVVDLPPPWPWRPHARRTAA